MSNLNQLTNQIWFTNVPKSDSMYVCFSGTVARGEQFLLFIFHPLSHRRSGGESKERLTSLLPLFVPETLPDCPLTKQNIGCNCFATFYLKQFFQVLFLNCNNDLCTLPIIHGNLFDDVGNNCDNCDDERWRFWQIGK